MVANPEKKAPVKMAGYLEKRGKMRMVCRWKRLWFVLKGRLLHYYKSQLEYVNLSPCRGSLNMGIAASVRPGKGLELQVLTRSQSIILRAANRVEQEQWLQALVDAMALQDCHISPPVKPVQHFRYTSKTDTLDDGEVKFKGCKSLDRLPSKIVQNRCIDHETSDDDENHENLIADDSMSLLSKSTSSNRTNCKLSSPDYCRCQLNRSLTSVSGNNTLSSTASFCLNRNQNLINKRLERLSLKSNKITSSDTAIPTSLQTQIHDRDEFINKNSNTSSNINDTISSEDKSQSLKELRVNVNPVLQVNDKLMKNSKDREIGKEKSDRSFVMNSKDIIIGPDLSRNYIMVTRSESLNSLKYKSVTDKKYSQEMKILIEGRTVYGSSDSVFPRNGNTQLSHKQRVLKEEEDKFEEEEKRCLSSINSNYRGININNNNKETVEKSTDLNDNHTAVKKTSITNRRSVYGNTEIKSDTDLSIRKQSVIISGSCGELSGCIISNCYDNFNINKNAVRLSSDSVRSALNKDSCNNASSFASSNEFNLNDKGADFRHDDLFYDSGRNLLKTKSNSLLRRLSVKDKDNNNVISKKGFHRHYSHSVTLERKGTLKKRSLSFLRRMWKWKESKILEGQTQSGIVYDQSCSAVMTGTSASHDREDPTNSSSSDALKEKEEKEVSKENSVEFKNIICPEEPPPDYDGVNTEDQETVPALPPRRLPKKPERSPSPWHDTPTNNKPVDEVKDTVVASPVDDSKPPPLPRKTRRSTRSSSSDISMSHHNYVNFDLVMDDNLAANNTAFSDKNENVIEVSSNEFMECSNENKNDDPYNNFKPFPLPELVEVNKQNDNSRSLSEEPIYDVPRPHATLRASLRKNMQHDKLLPTRFLNNSTPSYASSQKTSSVGSFEFDSLDANPALWRSGVPYDSVMTPDSLECESPCSLNAFSDDYTSLTITTWNHNNNFEVQRPLVTSDTLPRHFITIEEKQFEDSLNN